MFVIDNRSVAGVATREDLCGLLQFAPTAVKVPILDEVNNKKQVHEPRELLPARSARQSDVRRRENAYQDHFI